MRTRIAIAAVAAALVAVFVAALSSAAVVTTSHSGWTWGSPQPQGHSLKAIEFAGARGYAVGAFGTIVRTDDGGTTWAGLRTGTTQNLSGLQTIDAEHVRGGRRLHAAALRQRRRHGLRDPLHGWRRMRQSARGLLVRQQGRRISAAHRRLRAADPRWRPDLELAHVASQRRGRAHAAQRPLVHHARQGLCGDRHRRGRAHLPDNGHREHVDRGRVRPRAEEPLLRLRRRSATRWATTPS